MIWVLLICLVTTFYYYMKKKFTFFSSIGIPHQPGSFPLGSNVTWKMVKGKLPFIKICDEIYNEFKDDAKIAGYYGLFGTPTFVAIDEDLIKKILIKDFDHFLDRYIFETLFLTQILAPFEFLLVPFIVSNNMKKAYQLTAGPPHK